MELKTEFPNKLHIGRFSQNPKENITRKGPFKRAWGEWVKINGNLNSGYHIVSGEWTKDHLKYYLNGELVAYSPISMNCPKYLVANIAVPSNDGPFKPGPADSVIFSGDFIIDYIRVWSQEDTAETVHFPFAKADTSKAIASTSMRNTGRATYGPKKLHKNEGFTFSIFPKNEGYELCVLGKEIPKAPIEVFDERGIKVLTVNLKYGITQLNLFQDQKFHLKLKAYSRQQSLLLFEGRITKE